MANKKGAELVVEAVANTLSTNLNAQLTALWTAWADSSTVPQVNPQNIFAFGRDLISDFPALEVELAGGRMVSNGATQWGELDHRLIVTAWVRGDSKAVVQKMSARYLWAIWEVLMANQTLDGTVGGLAGVDPGQYAVGDVAKHASSLLYLQYCQWEVFAHVMESV